MPRLLDPFDVRARRAPSRVLFGPIVTNLGRHRELTDAHVALYRRRAAGGAGVIVVEEASVHASDHPYERSPLAERCGPGWSDVASACRAEGTPLVLAGLGHAGGQGTSHWHQRELWAPSAVPEVNTREVPKVMEPEDVAVVVAGFGAAAKLAAEAGLDGVEINAGQHSLVRQFLSGLTNQRGDEWGTDRLRFAREVLGAVRAAMGEGIVALRLSVDELAPWAGIVPEAGAAIAVELAPFVDLVTVVRGSIYSVQATRPDGHEPAGYGIGLAAQVRAALRDAGHDIPVVAQGSIVDPAQAEEALAAGACDAVEMTRALLADAELPRRHADGRPPRPCILCNQTCQVRDNRNPVITCVVDPRTGHELDDTDPETAPPLRPGTRITVVGAGVAGLEAARVAATRGASVTVIEAGDRVGGMVRIAARGAGRERLEAIADWLEGECRRLGVDVRLGERVDDLRADDQVIVATGGTDGPLPFEVDDGATVRHAAAVLRGDPLPDGPVAVWDPIGGPVAVSVAERLAGDGRQVVLVTPHLLVGEQLSLTGDLAPAQNRLAGLGVRVVKDAAVTRVAAGTVTVEDRWSGRVEELAAAALVACGHRLPDTTLDPDEALPHAGDRVAPRTIHEAILEGRRRALELRS